MGHISYIVRDLEAQGIRLPKVRMSKPAHVEVSRPVIVMRRMLPRNAVAERRAQVADLWQQGLGACEVATALGLKEKTVKSDVWHLQKFEGLPRRRAEAAVLDQRRVQVADLWKEGLTGVEIAEKLGVPASTVQADIWSLRKRGELDLESRNMPKLSAPVAKMVTAVAIERQISAREILGQSREHAVAMARQEVYLRALDAGRRISEIAKAFGRDRSTVVHGINAAALRRSKAVAK